MKTLSIPLIAACVLSLTACATPGDAASTSSADSEPRFMSALHACDLITTSDGVEYADDGATLILSTVGKENFTGLDWTNVECVLDDLDVSAATKNLIGETRALDGREDDDWDGIKASWTYHPDAGLNITLQDKRRD
ncbi:hypothetical protein [Curtobacterium sp. 458]|uniref:hypothetical protein n=1 Tax=Curtobacterium sp. 458 TaxID=3050069 RepID=UPI0025B3139F|nr:hypothetical protein [Curtobacterium sp. 458]WJY00400.1 hypothetical protein QPJ90_01595 [Curtobacterium sp. 458]